MTLQQNREAISISFPEPAHFSRESRGGSCGSVPFVKSVQKYRCGLTVLWRQSTVLNLHGSSKCALCDDASRWVTFLICYLVFLGGEHHWVLCEPRGTRISFLISELFSFVLDLGMEMHGNASSMPLRSGSSPGGMQWRFHLSSYSVLFKVMSRISPAPSTCHCVVD